MRICRFRDFHTSRRVIIVAVVRSLPSLSSPYSSRPRRCKLMESVELTNSTSNRLFLALALGESLVEALQVVVDGVVGLGGGLGRVHARAEGVLNGRATGRVVTGGSPASCCVFEGLVSSLSFAF